MVAVRTSPLFSSRLITGDANSRIGQAIDRVRQAALETLRQFTDEQYADQLFETLDVSLPVLLRDQHVLTHEEKPVPKYPNPNPLYQSHGEMVPGMMYTLRVPFEGDQWLFH